jgi:hypothetical protein
LLLNHTTTQTVCGGIAMPSEHEVYYKNGPFSPPKILCNFQIQAWRILLIGKTLQKSMFKIVQYNDERPKLTE